MKRRSVSLLAIALLFVLSGCCGQVKQAALRHAEATRGIAMTLEKSASYIDCAGTPDSTEFKQCQSALKAIKAQVPALEDGANDLERSAR